MNTLNEQRATAVELDLLYAFWKSPFYAIAGGTNAGSFDEGDVRTTLSAFIVSPDAIEIPEPLEPPKDEELVITVAGDELDLSKLQAYNYSLYYKYLGQVLSQSQKVQAFFTYAEAFAAMSRNRDEKERADKEENRKERDDAIVDSAMEGGRRVNEVVKRLKDPIDWQELKNR